LEETTDAQGVAHLPRDMFLDKSSRPIEGVTLRSPPPDSDDVIPVSVKTKPLSVGIPLLRTTQEMRGITMGLGYNRLDDPVKRHLRRRSPL
jgi:hypothetical protein